MIHPVQHTLSPAQGEQEPQPDPKTQPQKALIKPQCTISSIFSQNNSSLQPLFASINKNDINSAASAMAMDEFETIIPSPADYLINSLTSKSNQTRSPVSFTLPHKPQSLQLLNITLQAFLLAHHSQKNSEVKKLCNNSVTWRTKGHYYFGHNLKRFTARSNAQLYLDTCGPIASV